MRLPRSSSARARVLLALPLIAITLAGCGTSGSSTTTNVTATGSTLLVDLSDPATVRANHALQDVVYAEQLAWTQRAPAVKDLSLRLRTLMGPLASDNARLAIHQDSLIAYLGEISPGQSRQTVGITNAEDVLELSPSDGIRPTKDDFENFNDYGRTFASLPLALTTSPAALNKADPSFASSFKADFDHAPSADAILGYDAVWVLLRVLSTAKGQANNRSKIVASVIATLKANQGRAAVPAFTIKLK